MHLHNYVHNLMHNSKIRTPVYCSVQYVLCASVSYSRRVFARRSLSHFLPRSFLKAKLLSCGLSFAFRKAYEHIARHNLRSAPVFGMTHFFTSFPLSVHPRAVDLAELRMFELASKQLKEKKCDSGQRIEQFSAAVVTACGRGDMRSTWSER